MGQICSQCCAREREETIDCPFDCGHLIESRAHEKPRPVDLSLYPNLTPSRSFIDANEVLLVLLAVGLFGAAIETPGSVDRDVMECLEAAIRNRQSGLEQYFARDDAAEAHDLAGTGWPAAAALGLALNAVPAGSAGTTITLSPEQIEGLRSLGYVH